MKPRHQIDDNFLSQNIAVASNTLFCCRVAAVLVLPLIWAAFEEADTSFLILPNNLKDCIKSVCQGIDLNLEINPIDKIAIEPTSSGAELSFVEFIDPQNDGQGANQTRQLLSRNNSVMVSQQSV